MSFAITPSWLKSCILDEHITARTAPFLLCFAGLPNSGKSTALNQLVDYCFGDKIYNKNMDHGIRYYDFAAVRRPPYNEIIYKDAKSLVNNGYILVVESAIEFLLRVRGHSIKNVAVLPSTQPHFEDEDLNKHLISVFKNLSRLTCKSDTKETLSIWSQSLASGISMINIWDIGLNKAVLYILPRLAGLLYNCRSLLFFDLMRDSPYLYELPEIPENQDPSRNDKECVMRWRARIHYLLRFAKLSQDNPIGSQVCKLIATIKSKIDLETLEKNIKEFKKEVDMVSTQMKVKDLIDTDGVLDFHPNNDNSSFLKVLFDDIVQSQFQKPIDMPLSFVFLRSFFYTSSDISIKKDVLKQKAAVLGVKGSTFEEFCRLFTSFGSIIDVSLIDSSSDLIILKPVDFLHELDKLFYPLPNVDPLVTTYGIVTESTAECIFGSKEASSVFMSFLMSIGLTVKLSSEQLSITLSDQFAYYIPNICTAKPTLECEPTALHLLHDINEPLSHFKVKFAAFMLKEYHFTRLEMSKEPHINVTRFRAFPSTMPSDEGVMFDLVYLGDAIEFRIFTPYDHSCIEEICTQIITVCHKIMPQKVKYNFAVMCSEDPNPNAIYKYFRKFHILPNEDLCTKCVSKGRVESDIFKVWNAVLTKVCLNLYKLCLLYFFIGCK